MPYQIHDIELLDGSNFAHPDRLVVGQQFQVVNNGSPGAISSVAVSSPGQYGSLPTIGTSGDGSGATLVAHMKAVAAAVQAIGAGYAPGDTVTLTGGTESTNAVMTISTTQLASVAVNAAGSGYAPLDQITLAGGTFTSAAILNVVTTKLVAQPSVVAPGSGYAISDTITLAGGTFGTAAVLTVSHVQLVSLAINAGGSSYNVGDTVTLSGGTSSVAAVVTVTSVASGAITGFNITTAGNYTVESTTFTQASTSGSGSGATFHNGLFGFLTGTVSTAGSYTANAASFTQGSTSGSGTGATFGAGSYGVLTVSIANGGAYETNASTFTQGSTSGSGTGATFQTASYGVNAFTISTAGSYTVLPSNPVAQGSTSGSGSGATFNITGWGVGTVTVSAGGSGYDAGSAVTFTGGSPVTQAVTVITLGSTTGNNVTIPVTFVKGNLPTYYNVFVDPGQACYNYVTNKTSTGFTVTLEPISGNSVTAGNIGVMVVC